MTINPTQDRVLFSRVKKEESLGGIIIPGAQPTMECTVVAIGPKVTLLKVGDTIIVPHSYGYPLGEYEMCRELEVHAVLTST